MEIKITYENSFFSKDSRILGNCYIVTEENMEYHYEITISKHVAMIQADTELYLEEVAMKHHKLHPYISIYKGKDFYMEMEKVFTFKLPISILQVSKMFLNQNYIENLTSSLSSIDSIYIPVQIIDDEYVILDNHHLLYTAKELGYKMVEVFLDTIRDHTQDVLYFLKEQNIKTIQDVKCLPEEDYKKWEKDFGLIFSIFK